MGGDSPGGRRCKAVYGLLGTRCKRKGKHLEKRAMGKRPRVPLNKKDAMTRRLRKHGRARVEIKKQKKTTRVRNWTAGSKCFTRGGKANQFEGLGRAENKKKLERIRKSSGAWALGEKIIPQKKTYAHHKRGIRRRANQDSRKIRPGEELGLKGPNRSKPARRAQKTKTEWG